MTAAFETARIPLEGARQEACRLAREAYASARAQQINTWQIARDAVRARLEKAKAATADLPPVVPIDPKEAAAWQAAKFEFQAADEAMIQIEQQPSDRDLRARLDRDIHDADRNHYLAVNALRVAHGVGPLSANLGRR